MILIYSHISSPRLQYICAFLFKELMGIDFRITIDSEELKNYEGIRINYSRTTIAADEFLLQNNNLLFENNIQQQHTECFEINNTRAFFKADSGDFPFDIFAASFYLLSRYEEYLPHEKDMYGRYAHENALAFKEAFLNLPVINIWAQFLTERLKEKFSTFNFQLSTPALPAGRFNFFPTYDIDIAYSYKHKGFLRNAGGFIKSPSIKRIKVLAGLSKDPFDCYKWMNDLHQQNNLRPLYFFLVPEKNSKYDKNILPHKDAMWRLVKHHAKKYTIGLHPSWQAGDRFSLLKKEKELLEAMADTDQGGITRSRQHYIRFNLPDGYRRLTESGITDDYSMGYGSINGFRASVASSFYWYDLEKDVQTGLRIHPFCFMDANAYYEQKQTPQETLDELIHYLSVCKSVNGTLITIWHNNFLGTDAAFKEWREIYTQFIPMTNI